jgi:aspartokinase/homoserine dehydrogenase 1
MIQRVAILGASGNVGRELVKQITQFDTQGHRNPTKIIGVASSENFYVTESGITKNIIEGIIASRENARAILSKGEKMTNLSQLLAAVQDCGLAGEVIFVDATAGKNELLEFHKQVLQGQDSLVTANKNPAAFATMEEFDELTKDHGRYEFNTTVMGGAGAVNFIRDQYELRDKIQTIEGCFSGTLGFIMSQLEKGDLSFDQIVREAKDKGYTEPNPWDDLNGLDVARKLVILARCAGARIGIEDVKITPLIPARFAKLEGENFFHELRKENVYFHELRGEALAKNEVLRYMAKADFSTEKPELSVELCSVPKNSEAGSLSGPKNLIKIESAQYAGANSHVIMSPGAGLGITAFNLRKGILSALATGLPRR